MNAHATDLRAEKSAVPSAFDGIARWYDTLALLSPGYRHHLQMSARRLRLGPTARVLDLCCGTGLSTQALRAIYPEARIDALDASAGMLEKAEARGLPGAIRFVHGDATDPAAAGCAGPYDGILMAYGIRNLPEPDRALANVRELLAPGGVVCFHEYSVADSFRGRLVWEAVTRGVIIPLGRVTSPGTDIYRYLRRSVLAFDGVCAFERRLERAGFVDVRTEPMDLWARGVLHSFLARRPR